MVGPVLVFLRPWFEFGVVALRPLPTLVERQARILVASVVASWRKRFAQMRERGKVWDMTVHPGDVDVGLPKLRRRWRKPHRRRRVVIRSFALTLTTNRIQQVDANPVSYASVSVSRA